jgi:hypothetical protein
MLRQVISRIQKSYLFILSTAVILLLGFVFFKAQETKDPYVYFMSSDKDDIYTRLSDLKNSLDTHAFDKLVKQVFSHKNMDLFPMYIMTRFLNANGDTSYRSVMKKKLSQLEKIPEDSVWDSKHAYRNNSGNRNNSIYQELRVAVLQ